MQLLNMFFLLKDLMNRFLNENRKFSSNVMNQYILYLLQLLALIVNFYFIFLGFVLFPGTLTVLGTWWLCLNFTVYDIMYIYIYIYMSKADTAEHMTDISTQENNTNNEIPAESASLQI